MSKRFVLQVGNQTAIGELLEDTAPGVAQTFWDSLPLDSFSIHAKFAGGEMIVMLPFYRDAENEVLDVQAGDVAYFPDMQTMCVFYDDVTPFGYVSVFARIVDGLAGLNTAARSLVEIVSLPVRITRQEQSGSSS
jgi:hypothetical protein